MLTDNTETCVCGTCSTRTTNLLSQNHSSECHCSILSTLSNTCVNSKIKYFPSWKRTRRFHKSNFLKDSGWRTLIVVAIISIVLALPKMSNPLPLHNEEAGPSSGHRSRSTHAHSPKWINPCRIPSSLPINMDTDVAIITQSDPEIFQNIIAQVSKALYHARSFMDNYYMDTFGEDLNTRDKFGEVHYDFLSEITTKVTKSLGEEMTSNQLEELTVTETIKSMYSGLQMFAVGLEQIVLDQSVYSGDFHNDFQEAEYQLKYVLCELQIAMLEKNIKHVDITREIMSGEYRDIDCDSVRNIRDWTIFRDYVNTLEYIEQSFKQFLRNAGDLSQS